MKKQMKSIITVGVAALSAFIPTISSADNNNEHNLLGYSVAWKQTAAEYRALYYQGFNLAKMHLDKALMEYKKGDKPLAIVTDLDDTLVLPLEYWGKLIQNNKDFFEDPLWDEWIPTNGMIPSPGSKDFLEYAKRNNIDIFYVTSRNQGEPTWDLAKQNILAMGFPLKDDSHLTVLTDTSNKETRQNEILKDYNVVVFLGDNLNDFRRKYYIKGDVDGRIAKMEEDKDLFGSKYILFPNPTDGHWLAAIFGESEPEASQKNREVLLKAATKTAWQDK
ncbi:5'-nucleotidase, lipoprotein e(P4) family [Vibrio zhanjiangensis]|uniref:5'-nucleotidase, lipoprotein e(P4) family n=1 Tax=Vibrio zhanjiangensis TaxID=1046128 RepID=A0ABQ6F1M9_9VIBR|nr:HAD family acid phosphatase [Vibrio zhanjiangensis]GLT19164.1 5'-nucleotidase, lipoprotein e(P4) family [Vibrio zhanjiangensis]